MKAALLPVIALAMSGCDAEFIELNPPVVETFSRVIEHPYVDEPVVYAVILDLNIPDPVECQTAQALVVDAARALVPVPDNAMELPLQDLSPGCAQPSLRRIDVTAFTQQIATARTRFGDQRVRPAFFYANNVALPLSPGLRDDFASLRATGPAADRPATFLAVGSAAVLTEPFDTSVAWTFTGDPRLRTAIESAGRMMVPFRSRTEGQDSPVFPPELLARAQRFLWCNPGEALIPTGFAPGSTAAVDLGAPPMVRSTLPSAWLDWSMRVATASFTLDFQVCTDRCTRYVENADGVLTRWHTLTTCLPVEPAE